MKSLLVVCEGNICRSPMAQGLLQDALPSVRVSSAGLGALVGMPADGTAVQLMEERGIDISDHRAVQITEHMCLDADLVFVMSQSQRERVEEMYPLTRGRIFRLGEYRKQDIPDPYRKPERAFREALVAIDLGVEEWLRRIQRL